MTIDKCNRDSKIRKKMQQRIVKLQIKLKCHKLCHVIAITYCTV